MSKDNRQGQQPPRPTGSGRPWVFFGRVWDRCFGPEGRILDTNTITVDYTTKGIKLNARVSPGGAGTSILQCVVTQLYGTPNNPVNYIGVTQFNLQTMALVGAQFFCAKCTTGRQPAAETIDGEAITYNGYNAALLPANNPDNVRTANFGGGNTEIQVMSPRYLVMPALPLSNAVDISQFLVEVSTLQNPVGVKDANGAQITYVELQPGRRWAYSPSLNGGND